MMSFKRTLLQRLRLEAAMLKGSSRHFTRKRDLLSTSSSLKSFSNRSLSSTATRGNNNEGDLEFLDPLMEDYFPTSTSSASTSDTNETSAEFQEIERQQAAAAKHRAILDELDSRTGRLWSDPLEFTDEDWAANMTSDDLPDWTKEICSRVSLERVQVHPDGIPSLDKLSNISIPIPPPPHPALGDPYPYLKFRKTNIQKRIDEAVVTYAKPHVERILSMDDGDWDKKQEAIDVLFEQASDGVKNLKTVVSVGDQKKDDDYMRMVLGSQPNFNEWVEKSLENYLKNAVKSEKESWNKAQSKTEQEKIEGDENVTISDEDAVPIFMDLLKAKGAEVNEEGIPKILYPLSTHKNDGPGRMLEEWELAADEETKRIMVRKSIRETAKALAASSSEEGNEACRVYVKGRSGAGKSATLAAIVASARTSGHIVLYLPDGDRLRKLGFYNEPNEVRFKAGENFFDLPLLTKEVCGQLLDSHEKDMEGMVVADDCLAKFNTKKQLKAISKLVGEEQEKDSTTLVQLLKFGSEDADIAAGCYGAVIHTLMNQTSVPFTIVMDQFNCFFDHGQYFHAQYDPNVRKPIPLNKFTLFEPMLDAMGVEKLDDGSIITKDPILMKRGGIIVGTTESHAVPRKISVDLSKAVESNGCKVVEATQYSNLEVDHILANFEVTGIGRLRFDRGETVMNKHEVAYLRMVSGNIGQKLLDECCTL